jgi:hypothetical protein
MDHLTTGPTQQPLHLLGVLHQRAYERRRAPSKLDQFKPLIEPVWF